MIELSGGLNAYGKSTVTAAHHEATRQGLLLVATGGFGRGRGAGQAAEAALTLEQAIAVSNSSFSKSDGYGILKKASDTTPYETSNTFEAVARGNVGSH